MRKLLIISAIPALLAIWGCASIGVLSGGPEDTTPPQIDSSKYSTPDKMTRFAYNEILLTFNEWIKLNDASTQVTVSPLQKEKPEVKIKGKTVVVKFKEALKPNTTYAVEFNDAIQDITKGNTAKNLRRVFSTGDIIDSMKVSGIIANANGNDIEDKCLVLLFDNLEDSAFTKLRPMYVTKMKTEEKTFSFENISPGKYRLYALVDNNYNYRYDLDNEKLAFMDSVIELTGKKNDIRELKLRLFEKISKPKLASKKAVDYRKISFTFIDPLSKDVRYRILTNQKKQFFRESRKKVTIWFEPSADPVKILVNEKDTILLKFPAEKDFTATKPALVLKTAPDEDEKSDKNFSPSSSNLAVMPGKPYTLAFNNPIVKWDSTKIKFSEDSSKKKVIYLAANDSSGNFVVNFKHPLKKKYELLLAPGALTDVYGLMNKDTIRNFFNTLGDGDEASITLKLHHLNTTSNYFVQLIDMSQKLDIEQRLVPQDTAAIFKFSPLPPGQKYSVRLIKDDNKNGEWDTGNYSEKKQPEMVWITPPIDTKSRFESETSIDLLPTPGFKDKKGKEPPNKLNDKKK